MPDAKPNNRTTERGNAKPCEGTAQPKRLCFPLCHVAITVRIFRTIPTADCIAFCHCSDYLKIPYHYTISGGSTEARTAQCNSAAVSLADVTSANIVGYHQVTLQKGWNMLAVNWENCSDADGISIQDLIPGTTEGLTGNMAAASADQIQIYDAKTGGYTVFSLFLTTLPSPILQAKNYKWVDNAGNVSSYKFKSGDSLWFMKQGAEAVSVSLSGQVSIAEVQDVVIVKGWNMIGSAFPANFNPNQLGTEYWQTSGAVGNMAAANADQIQVYDPATQGYTVFSLFLTTLPSPILQAKNWKWVDNAGNPIDNSVEVIKPGSGVWYMHQGEGFTFKIASPIADK